MLLWRYWQKPLDAWSWHIEDIALVDDPHTVHNARDRRGQGHHAVWVGPSPCFLPVAVIQPHTISYGGRGMQFEDLGGSWGFDTATLYPCYWVPEPVLRLIAMKRWNAVLVLHNHMLGLSLKLPYPPDSWIKALGTRLRARLTSKPELNRRVASTAAGFFSCKCKACSCGMPRGTQGSPADAI